LFDLAQGGKSGNNKTSKSQEMYLKFEQSLPDLSKPPHTIWPFCTIALPNFCYVVNMYQLIV
jgi:hypothetical protein